MIKANVNLWMQSRKDLEKMLKTLQEQNLSRDVYISLEGGRGLPLDDGELIERIIEELSYTVHAMNEGDAFNRPPLTEAEKRLRNDEFLAAECGFDSVEEYRAWEDERSMKFMKKLADEAGLNIPEGMV